MESNGFFLKLTFHMNKTFETWGNSLQLPYADKTDVSVCFMASNSSHLIPVDSPQHCQIVLGTSH